jgi:hypothetical protein
MENALLGSFFFASATESTLLFGFTLLNGINLVAIQTLVVITHKDNHH